MSNAAPHDEKRFRPGFVWWVAAAGAALAAALILLSFEIREGFTQTRTLRAEVTRSYETRAELQKILSLHLDLETGQRGFTLTGDRGFLEPYEASGRNIDAAFTRLGGESLAGLASRDEVAALREASAAKRRFAAEMVTLGEAGQADRARARVASGEGKRLMDRLRAQIDQIDLREQDRLEQRTQLVDEARGRLQARIEALQYFLIGLLVVALGFLLRAYRGWERALARQRDYAARQEAIFAAARDGMLVINASGSIESLNPAAARMFGYAEDELLRRDVGILIEIAPRRGRMAPFLKRLAPHPQAPGNTRELTARRKDGAPIPVEVSVSPVRLDGQLRFLAVVRDVTERRQVDQMKTEFVSTVSHELRTPLTSIAGSLGLIAGGAAGELPERATRLIEIAQSNSARLIRLINDILDIEKIESGRMTFAVTAVPLARILPQAIEAIRPFAATYDVALRLGEVPAHAVVLADEDRLMQVVTNLLSNATKWSPHGGTVTVGAAPHGRQFRISVADDGPGIADEFRPRIFGKFAQADSSDTRQKGGTGLGLAIVREIVERLGGSVSFDSAPGEGTVFHVDLPAARPADDRGDQPEALGRISDAADPLVLHVDDDPDMLRLVSSALEGRAQVHSSPSVIEARAAIRRYRFDVAILDIGMADGDGLELVPLIRRRQDTPIVVFTAQDAEQATLADVDLVLVKSRDSLARLVDEVERLTAAGKGAVRA